ncbi:MAG: hypothetical protein HY543_09760 [Deltaproteobacteria bacterium]|nr:hypothetical protein [Deltaproteobacteria bacterium]
MRNLFALLAILCVWPTVGHAGSRYIYTNRRFDYVKLQEIGKKDLAAKAPTHPATISVEQMRAVLGSMKLSRKLLFKDEIEHQEIYNERAVNFLAPHLVEAFRQAGPEQEVVFSWIFKDPFFIIRNDRVTVARAWVANQEFHVEFLKLFAKLEGDYDKRGNFDKALNRAKSLRIELEPQPGQMLGASNAHELVLDLGRPIAAPVAARGKPVNAAEVTLLPRSTKARLTELEKLRKKELITEEEYQRKRTELLQAL